MTNERNQGGEVTHSYLQMKQAIANRRATLGRSTWADVAGYQILAESGNRIVIGEGNSLGNYLIQKYPEQSCRVIPESEGTLGWLIEGGRYLASAVGCEALHIPKLVDAVLKETPWDMDEKFASEGGLVKYLIECFEKVVKNQESSGDRK